VDADSRYDVICERWWCELQLQFLWDNVRNEFLYLLSLKHCVMSQYIIHFWGALFCFITAIPYVIKMLPSDSCKSAHMFILQYSRKFFSDRCVIYILILIECMCLSERWCYCENSFPLCIQLSHAYRCLLLQLNHPDKVDGLVLIDCTAKQAGWIEWGYQKVCIVYMWLSIVNKTSQTLSGWVLVWSLYNSSGAACWVGITLIPVLYMPYLSA